MSRERGGAAETQEASVQERRACHVFISATAKRDQFPSEYNDLRRRELDPAPIDPAY